MYVQVAEQNLLVSISPYFVAGCTVKGGAKRKKQAWLLWPEDAGSPDEAGLTAFAGIWSAWGEGDDRRETFAVLTTAARSEVAHIHERMPVVLRPD